MTRADLAGTLGYSLVIYWKGLSYFYLTGSPEFLNIYTVYILFKAVQSGPIIWPKSILGFTSWVSYLTRVEFEGMILNGYHLYPLISIPIFYNIIMKNTITSGIGMLGRNGFPHLSLSYRIDHINDLYI